MYLIGLAFLIDWLLQEVFELTDLKATLVTGLLFLVVGALLEGYPLLRKRP